MKFQNPFKVGYLQQCCNKYGDFKVCTRNPDGSWTKHYSVLYCWSNLETEGWRLDKANNRTAFPCELILDFDAQPNENPGHLRGRLKVVCRQLVAYEEKFKVYFTGSRGFHIHILIPSLESEPQSLRQYTANELGCDVQVVGPDHMIALENCPHWKTGLMKKEVLDWENL